VPLLEHEASRPGRLRVFLRAQLPFAVATALVGIAIALALPQHVGTPLFLGGLSVAALSTLLAVLVPWERWSSNTMAWIALLDLVAVAFLRTELVHVAPAVSFLCVFPILWLAYGFTQRMMVVAVAGTLLIAAFPFIVEGRVPTTPLDWLSLLLLPFLTIGIAIAVNIGARQLRRTQRAVRQHATEVEESLARALDAETLADAILNTVEAGVAFYTPDGQLRLSNQRAADMVAAVGFRLDTPPYAGTHVLAADRKTTIPAEEQIIPRALRGEEIAGHMEWLGPVGEQHAILATSSRVVRPDGELLGTVVVAHDVTELANAVSVREEFLTTVSHELRTPLTSIHGYLELVTDDAEVDAPQLLPALAVIRRNAEALERRVQELLTASDSTVVLQRSDVDLAVVAADAVAAAQATDATVTLSADGPFIAAVDAVQVRRAVAELVVNAAKFSPDGRIQVTLAATEQTVQLRVTDDGVGMTTDELRQAFDKFYRTPYANERAVQGVGLGLHAARAIAEAHGGSLVLASTPGVGTEATFTIPVAGPAAA
jgi:signal transduction histidine kinase